jgi:DNA repair protein SbcD/Mre11
MKILHSADWHIGQLFHEYDRTYEHQQFLNWLVKTLNEEQVEVLLISGDVFDSSNPSATAIKMFYTFLNRAVKINPLLQIIVTAGNHDSASRLESPKPLLESSNIHIIGIVEKDETGNIDYKKLIIPLKDNQGNIKAWCMAVPFLRMGDYPIIANCNNPYAEGVAKLYEEAYQYALDKIQDGQSVICMGHLHTQQAEKTEMDDFERLIMGGVECIAAAAFHEDIKYVALGHIHKAQRIGGKDHIRYCGSPIPMSFSELNYKHQVIVFDLEEGELSNLQAIEVPVTIPLLRVPSRHSIFSEVLIALEQLPPISGHPDLTPYVEVCVLLDSPEPALRYKIQSVLNGKNARLAKINVKYPGALPSEKNGSNIVNEKLEGLQPSDIFSKTYLSRYNNPVPDPIQVLFNQVAREVSQMESE